MTAVEGLARRLLELLTEGLGLEPRHFSQYLEKERMISMRFNFYPPCPEPSLAIGLQAHTDPHLLTILHQDSVAGLQVQIHDKWVTVKPRPDCFVVNIGDLFQVLIYLSYLSSSLHVNPHDLKHYSASIPQFSSRTKLSVHGLALLIVIVSPCGLQDHLLAGLVG